MTTAIIGVGQIGGAVARNLVEGGEQVVLAADHAEHATKLAGALGERASAASFGDAIAGADTVVLAVWLDTIKELITSHGDVFDGKVVIDPSNPIGFDESGQTVRTLPEDQSAGSVVASLLPPGAHYVKALGSLGADSLAGAANRAPRVALFYATDDDQAAAAVEHVITVSGFDPVRAGGVAAAGRIEVPGGDLHQHGGLGGALVSGEEARAAVAAA